MARREADPVRITSATASRGEDIARRQRRYLISMGIRSAAFVGAVVVALTIGNGILMWVLIAASFLLPYFAVVAANAGYRSDPGVTELVEPDPARKALGQGDK